MSTRKFRYDLQPLGDFTQKEANQLKEELEKHLVTIYLTEIEMLPKKDIPAFYLYKPSNRYWTGKILGFLKQQNQESDFVTHRTDTSRHLYLYPRKR